MYDSPLSNAFVNFIFPVPSSPSSRAIILTDLTIVSFSILPILSQCILILGIPKSSLVVCNFRLFDNLGGCSIPTPKLQFFGEYSCSLKSFISHTNFFILDIKLKLTNNKIPPQLEHSIITAIEKNKYYRDKKNTYLKNLKIKREYVEASIQKIDTLLFAKKGMDNDDLNRKNLGTTILLDKNQNTNLELKLFDNYSTLNNELIYINNELNKKANIINIISSFPMTAEISNKSKNHYILSGSFLFLFTLIIILFKRINELIGQDPNFKIPLVNFKE